MVPDQATAATVVDLGSSVRFWSVQRLALVCWTTVMLNLLGLSAGGIMCIWAILRSSGIADLCPFFRIEFYCRVLPLRLVNFDGSMLS